MSEKFVGYEALEGFSNVAKVLEALAHHAFQGQLDLNDLAMRLPNPPFNKRALKKVMEDFTKMGIVIFDDPIILLQPVVSWDESASGDRRQMLRAALVEAGIEEDELPPADSLDDTLPNRPVEPVEAPPASAAPAPDFSTATTRRNEPVLPAENELLENDQLPDSEPVSAVSAPAPEITDLPPVSEPLRWGQKGGLPLRPRAQREAQPERPAPDLPVPESTPTVESPPEQPAEQPPPPEDRLRWGQERGLPGKKTPHSQPIGAPASESPSAPPASPMWERSGSLPSKKRPGSGQSTPPVQTTPPAGEPPESETPAASSTPASGSTWSRNPGLPTRKRESTNSPPPTPLPPRKPGASPRSGTPPPASPIGRSGGRMNRPGLDIPASASGDSQSSMSDENVQELIARLLEERDLATVDVKTAEAYAQAIQEYVEKLKSAGLDTDPAAGVRLAQLLTQLLTRSQGTFTDEE